MSEQQNLNEFNRYLHNNRELLQQKHHAHFGQLAQSTLQNVPVNALIEYIYDVFTLDKYKQDEHTHRKIVSSLTHDLEQFKSSNQHRSSEIYNEATSIEVLTYCIQHNEMFHVEYLQKGNNKEETDPSSEQQLNVEIVRSSNSKQAHQNEQEQIENGSKQNSLLAQSKMLEQQIRNRQKGSPHHKIKQQEESNQFIEGLEPMQFNPHSELIKKNARIAYLSFCKNQMELGGKRTFDNLEEEANTMTIGKLLVYVKAYQLFNQHITKQLLMHRFKRISEGKRTIDFDKFYILLTSLLEIDPDLFTRLRFHDQTLHKNLKFVKYPFYTQDQHPRENVICRAFSNQLTSHSGKMQEELKLDLHQKKIQRNQQEHLERLKSVDKYHPKTKFYKQKERYLSPKDLTVGGKSNQLALELSFIDKIVQPEDNDQQFLKQYQLYHNLKEENMMHYHSSNRKDSIIQNIRKRIQQLEHSESEITKVPLRPTRKRYNAL